jgi:uncharacterized protein
MKDPSSMDQDSTLRTSRDLPHSPDAVYAAFASPDVLASWWGPDGFTNSFEVFEFQVGGRWKFTMHGPDGRNYPNESEFSALEPAAKVVIRHVSPPRFTLTVDLTPVAGGTHLEWQQAFEDRKTAQALKRIVEPANEQNLDRLARALGRAAGAASDQPICLRTRSGQINGSLLLAKGIAKAPVVLLISGSGPTDRNGNSGGVQGRNDSLKMLALSLSGAGFASVRYDKRGVGASAGAAVMESDLRLDTYVEDAAAWIDTLASDGRFSGIAVVGHSEGSLIGMLAVQGRSVRSFASIAGVARGASSILRQQLHGKLPLELAERSEAILSSLEKGQVVDDVPAQLASLYRPSVQPYLISWFKYVPAREIQKLRIPCLILQGDTDVQVPVSEASALKAAKPDADLRILRGMNHVLKLVPLDDTRQIASYGDPALPIAPELSRTLVRFLCGSMKDDRSGPGTE